MDGKTQMTVDAIKSIPLRPRASGAVVLFVMVLGTLPVFWLGLASLGQAWMTPEYSHGPLIPLISLFLFLRELRDTPAPPRPQDCRPGLLVVGLGLLLAAFGNIAGIPDIVTYGLILWLAGVVLICMGWQDGRRHQLAVFHLVFMLPLPQFLYWKLTIFLQALSSELGTWFIRLADIPVYQDGNVIDLGPYKLLVAEACSGLRYLFPILSFSYLMAILYRGPLWHKLLLFAMAAPLCVVMNAVRIGVIGVLVNFKGIDAAEGFLHLFEGWVIFAACIGVLMLTAVALQHLALGRAKWSQGLDLEFAGLGQQAARVVQMRASPVLVLAAAMGMVASTAFVLAPQPPHDPPPRAVFSIFPDRLGPWSGVQFALEPATAEVLGATDYINSSYHHDHTGREVQFFSAWYASQTAGQGIHSPEVCLPGAGWEIFALVPLKVRVPGSVYGTFTLNRAIIENGLDRQLVYFWFEQRGRRVTHDFAAKLTVLRDGLMTGRTDGALVRFLTPIAADEDVRVADARLQSFMAETLTHLPLYVPE
ncbi:MAG: VPLPA-CTERM-specific exosortase XrtD [Pseudomonadota bacterium]